MSQVDSDRVDNYTQKTEKLTYLESKDTIPKIGKSSGEEKTEAEKLNSLFLGGNLATATEQELGVSKGDRRNRIKIYEKIEEVFYDENNLDEDSFNALETLKNSNFNTVNSLVAETGSTHLDLIEAYQRMDEEGFVDYGADGGIEVNDLGRYAAEFIQEHEDY